jgi:hypothetical protein
MIKISIALLTGAGVLFANSATAAGVFTNDATYLGVNQHERGASAPGLR